MPQNDCNQFTFVLTDISERREILKAKKRKAEIRLELIDDRQGEILREIAIIGFTLPPMRFRPRRRQRRPLFDDFDDAETFLSAENARRKVRTLESESMALRAEARQHEVVIERFNRQMDELRREEEANRINARRAGC